MILSGLLILVASSAGAVASGPDFVPAADRLESYLEASISSATPKRLRVTALPPDEPEDAALSNAFVDVMTQRVLAQKRFIPAAGDPVDIAVYGRIGRLNGSRRLVVTAEDLAQKSWIYSETSQLSPALNAPPAESAEASHSVEKLGAPQIWIGAGAAGLGEGVRGQVEIAARHFHPNWEAALSVSGQYEQKDGGDTPYNGGSASLQSDIKTSYERIRISRYFPIARTQKKSASFGLPLPDFVSVGAGCGFYVVSEKISTSSFVTVPPTATHFYSLPFVEAALTWKLGVSQELRASGSYSKSSPTLAFQDRIGGFGFGLTLNVRLN